MHLVGYNCTSDYCLVKSMAANITCERIRTHLDCEHAAQQLGLSDTTVEDDGQDSGKRYDPPYCYFERDELKFNDGMNTGICSSFDNCLCHNTAPTMHMATESMAKLVVDNFVSGSYVVERCAKLLALGCVNSPPVRESGCGIRLLFHASLYSATTSLVFTQKTKLLNITTDIRYFCS